MISVTMGSIDNAKAKKELGFAPTALGDVVKQTVAWNLSPAHQVYTMKMQEDTTSSSDSDSSSSSGSSSGSGSEKEKDGEGDGFMTGDSSDEGDQGVPGKEEGTEPFRFDFKAA